MGYDYEDDGAMWNNF